MNITQKLNLFVIKGTEGDHFRRKVATVAVAIALIVLVALAIYIAVSASPSVAGLTSVPASLSANPELIVTRRNAAVIPLSTNPELLVARRYAETGPESAFSRTAAELALASNYGAGEVILARRYAANKGKVTVETNLSANPELNVARRIFHFAPQASLPRTASELSLANSFGASEQVLSERYGATTNIESAFPRTAVEKAFAQRYQSAGQLITTTYERTPAELEFSQRYLSAGHINTSSQSTPIDFDFAPRYCATEEQLNERYGCE
jgi:hypothetical protein